jgi:ABC-type antimicrobial peptide transport system permease subunit
MFFVLCFLILYLLLSFVGYSVPRFQASVHVTGEPGVGIWVYFLNAEMCINIGTRAARGSGSIRELYKGFKKDKL